MAACRLLTYVFEKKHHVEHVLTLRERRARVYERPHVNTKAIAVLRIIPGALILGSL
jgi:hypothetical protein